MEIVEITVTGYRSAWSEGHSFNFLLRDGEGKQIFFYFTLYPNWDANGFVLGRSSFYQYNEKTKKYDKAYRFKENGMSKALEQLYEHIREKEKKTRLILLLNEYEIGYTE